MSPATRIGIPQTVAEAEKRCLDQGARLFQPRSEEAMIHLKKMRIDNLKPTQYYFSLKQTTYVVTGLMYEKKMGDGQFNLYYK